MDCDEPLSHFGFNFNLRSYDMVDVAVHGVVAEFNQRLGGKARGPLANERREG
jgi:hypothetical protein